MLNAVCRFKPSTKAYLRILDLDEYGVVGLEGQGTGLLHQLQPLARDLLQDPGLGIVVYHCSKRAWEVNDIIYI